MKKIILALLIFIALERVCYLKTAGSRTQKIEGALAYDPKWETTSYLSDDQISALFSKPFRFLGSGAQSFAFVSEDGTTVLKFMKQNRRRPIPWLESLPLPSLADKWRKTYLEKRQRRLEEVLGSAKIACDELSKQTGVLHAHLNTTPKFNKTVTLYDKLGIQHTVNIDNTLFTLRKRGVILMDEPLQKKTIAGMIQHVKACCSRGIAHTDPVVERNFGVYQGEVFTIDFGSFKYDEKLKTFPYLQRETFYELLTLRSYIKKNNPELLSYYDETLHHELIPSP